uniref:Uncharacterized protein n=1 Tax=Terrapene triunguis TaxID=2587831 RepID=A0A674JKG3_9SAUR
LRDCMGPPLQAVVEHMAGRLQVRPEQILLLLRDTELPPGSTPQGLGLGVADIIGEVCGQSGAGADGPRLWDRRLSAGGVSSSAVCETRRELSHARWAGPAGMPGAALGTGR